MAPWFPGRGVSNTVDDPFSPSGVRNHRLIKFQKVIRKRLDRSEDGISVAGELNAAISANVNEPGVTKTDVRSTSKVVQRTDNRQTTKEEK